MEISSQANMKGKNSGAFEKGGTLEVKNFEEQHSIEPVEH